MTTAKPRVKICDFGIAALADSTAGLAMSQAIGTPAYMSPEQIQATQVEGPADVYSLGATMFHLLSGRLLFDVPVEAMLYSHVHAHPMDVRLIRPGVPPPWRSW